MIKTGIPTQQDLRSPNSSKYITIGDGESKRIVFLGDLQDTLVYASVHEIFESGKPAKYHLCLDSTDEVCPSCEAGHKPRMKFYLPVATKEEGAVIWSMPKTVYEKVAEINDVYEGNIKGLSVVFSRKGTGLKTRYSVTATGKRMADSELEAFELPDVVASLGPQTRSGILDYFKQVEDRAEERAKKAVSGSESDLWD